MKILARGALAFQDWLSGKLLTERLWAKIYAEDAPPRAFYDTETLDPDFLDCLQRLGPPAGCRALDIGTGLGTAARELSKLGYAVTAVDESEAALALARARAGAQAEKIRYVAGDITRRCAGGSFELAYDRGCFHCIAPSRRDDYVDAAAFAVAPGGRLYLKTMSRRELLTPGPYRFSPEDIAKRFGQYFVLEQSVESRMPRRFYPPHYLLCVLRRKTQKSDYAAAAVAGTV